MNVSFNWNIVKAFLTIIELGTFLPIQLHLYKIWSTGMFFSMINSIIVFRTEVPTYDVSS